MISIESVRHAATRIGTTIVRTPFLHSQTLSDLTGAKVWLKFENLQFTASFKERGALNKLLLLPGDAKEHGVVAVSAGNHAQGVALHARNLGIPATIIMPHGTPNVKVRRTEGFGATVVLHGHNFEEASTLVAHYVDKGMTFIHPFDDPDVMAGQGTIGLEMLEQGPQLDALIVPVGGGGLINGVAAVFSALSPRTDIYGVESELYPSMAKALGFHTGAIRQGSSIAEGIAVADASVRVAEQMRECVRDIIVVPEAGIEDAIAHLLQIEKTLCEGAGAAGLAALLTHPDKFDGKAVGLILSGGNIDMRVLAAVLQRRLARNGSLFRLRVTTLDDAGSLGRIATLIGEHGGNILHVHHDRTFGYASAKNAGLFFQIEIADEACRDEITKAISLAGFDTDLGVVD